MPSQPRMVPGLHGAVELTSKTVIYGGSFDPPHVGHLMACTYLLEALGAARVLLVPAFEHALNKELSPFDDRAKMCRAFAEFDSRVAVDEIERELSSGGRTLPMVRALAKRYPENRWVLAVGADILMERHRWHRWDRLLEELPIVVIGRQGYASEPALVQLPEVSSTMIRQRAAQGLPLTGLVPLSVARVIHAQRLYRGDY